MSWRVAESLDVLLAEINAAAPSRSKASDGSIGDEAHSSRDSDHNPCDCHDAVCARDFTHDPGHGFDSYAFADWLRSRCKNGAETRVKYVISNRMIASPTQNWAWRQYTGSNPHTQHVHVSVDHPSACFDDDRPWDWGEEGWIVNADDKAYFDKKFGDILDWIMLMREDQAEQHGSMNQQSNADHNTIIEQTKK